MALNDAFVSIVGSRSVGVPSLRAAVFSQGFAQLFALVPDPEQEAPLAPLPAARCFYTT